jgi:hypothetical protein
MKIKVDLECSAEEARAFLGLPDLRPVHDVVVQEMRERVVVAARAIEPEGIMRLWFPASGFPGLDSFQKLMGGLAMAGGKSPEKEDEK